MIQYTNYILVYSGTGCRASRGEQVIENLRAAVEQYGSEDTQVIRTGCFGFCEEGPMVKMIPDNAFYMQVRPSDAGEIVQERLIKGRKVGRLLYMSPETHELVPDSKHIRFYKKQLRTALRNYGFINPENVDKYTAHNGYVALGKALVEITPGEVIKEIMNNGLWDRGGGGSPTGLKWQTTHRVRAPQKYVVCNADRGGPGAFAGRPMLEGNPHSVVEAMAINGYCAGASEGLVYIRAKYPLAVERLKIAIRQAKEHGLLGESIFGTDFSFDIKIRYGIGAFVYGEETALIYSMEGSRGEATVKPPFPSGHGYRDYPANVNNIRIYTNIPVVLLRGAKQFSSIGTEKNKGTKMFALAGKVNSMGLIEVPMDTTLREVIFGIRGGIKDGKEFKTVQAGGPSGGCLTERHLDLPIDHDNLSAAGPMMGSGGMIVMDGDDCMVAMAKFYLGFTAEESCDKYAPCRISNKRLHKILQKIISGSGAEEDLTRLRNLAMVVKDTVLYGLGQTSPNPVLPMMDNFYGEYLAHVREHRCPSHRCRELTQHFINPERCKGCTLCAHVHPVYAIIGGRKIPHIIDPQACIRCDACMEKCKFGAIYVH